MLMNKVERQRGRAGVTELFEARLETLQRPVCVDEVVPIVDEHPVVRRAHPNVVATIGVPEVAELLKRGIEVPSGELLALVSAGLALSSWDNKHVKQQERLC